MKLNMDLLAVATYKYSGFWSKKVGAPINFPTISLPTPIPITISPSIQFRVEAKADLQVKGTATMGFDYMRSVRESKHNVPCLS